jgi:sugar lactone lactonase YvrE
VESPRWHDGRLWFSHWGAEEVLAVDLEGHCEVVAPGRPGLGWATAWLPTAVSSSPARRCCAVNPTVHSSCTRTSATSARGAAARSSSTARANNYINSIEFDFLGGGEPTAGVIALITPDGAVRQVAGDLAFPDGMVVTPDNSTLIVGESFVSRLTAFDVADDGTLNNRRTWADNVGPDGITMDAEGGIWCSSATMAKDCARVREGGTITDRIELDRDCFACMLGGPDRRTLFMMTAEWLGPDKVDEALARRTGRVLATEVEVPGVGWP